MPCHARHPCIPKPPPALPRPLLPAPHTPPAKECGLHSGNVKKEDGTTEERKAERDLWGAGSAVVALDKAQAEALASSSSREQDTLLVLYAPWCPFCQVGEAGCGRGCARQQADGGAVGMGRAQCIAPCVSGVEFTHLLASLPPVPPPPHTHSPLPHQG